MPGSTPRKRNFVNPSNFASLNKINAIGNLSVGSLLGKKQVIAGAGIPITPSISITPTNTPTISDTPTQTPTETPTPTATLTLTPTITRTFTPTNSITPTVTPTLTKTISPTPFVTPTNTRTITPTNSLTPFLSQTPTISLSPTQTPTVTPTPTYTKTPTVTPSLTQSPTLTQTPTTSPTVSNPLEYELFAVGANSYGQLGLGNLDSTPILQKVNIPLTVDYISVGGEHTIVGQVATNRFYGAGNNNSFQLGLSSNVFPLNDYISTFQILGYYDDNSTGLIGLTGNWKYIVAGSNYSIAVSATPNNSTLFYYVGFNEYGQFGNGTTFPTYFEWIKSDFNFGKLRTNPSSEIVLAAPFDGSVYVYGAGIKYVDGVRESSILNYEKEILPPVKEAYSQSLIFNILRGEWSDFYVGNTLMYGTSAKGSPYQWYYMGQLPSTPVLSQALFAQPLHSSSLSFKKVVAGNNHMLALSSQGRIVYGIGDSAVGQLGSTGTLFGGILLDWTPLDGEWDDIYAAGDCSWLKMKDSTDWYASGFNAEGQLAINSADPIVLEFSGPIPLANVSQIESNGDSTFVIAPLVPPTPTPTPTITCTSTHTPTETPTHTPTETPTHTPTETPTPTPSITQTSSVTPTPTKTPDIVGNISGSSAITTIDGETIYIL